MLRNRHVPRNVFAFTFLVLLGTGGTASAQDTSAPTAKSAERDENPQAPVTTAVSPDAIAWIRDTAIPFQSVQAESGFDDLRPLAQLIGKARIVALGEPTHGSREVFQMKHRLLEYLASEMGFTIFSIEASMPEAYALDDYVLHGQGNPRALIGGMHFWTWNTEEVLSMVDWMRRFNAAGKGPVHFTGFDMQSLNAPVENLSAFIGKARPKNKLPVFGLDNAKWQSALAVGRRPSFGVATATFPVELARGKRVHYSGWIRTQDVTEYAGLWWRVDGEKGVIALNNMYGSGPHGTQDWAHYEIELTVDPNATNIKFGVLMPGKGSAWFDDLQIKLDGVDYKPGPELDLDFESDKLEGFSRQESGGYQTRSSLEPQHGRRCLQIEYRSASGMEAAQSERESAHDVIVGLQAAARVLKQMEAARAELTVATSVRETEWAIQNARIIYQLMASKAAEFTPSAAELQEFRKWVGVEEETLNVRDASMASNIAWILEQNPGAKIVLWAHNGHVSREQGAMGQYLEKRLPGQMVVLGFCTTRGRYTAYGKAGLGEHDLQPPPAGSVEAILSAAGIPRLVLDLRGAPGSSWVAERRLMRLIGAMAQDEQFFEVVPRDYYDALVFLEETTPAVQLPTRPR